MHMQQAMKHEKTLEPVRNDLDTFDIGDATAGKHGLYPQPVKYNTMAPDREEGPA